MRDCAVEVMTKSSRYKSHVEPELTKLNQRWAELLDRIKVRFFSFCILKKKCSVFTCEVRQWLPNHKALSLIPCAMCQPKY